MAFIRLDPDAAKAMVEAANAYAAKNNRDAMEMGVSLMLAGVAVLSVRTNDVQIDEIYEFVSKLAAPLRKPNAS